MKFYSSSTKHTLTVSGSEAVQALSDSCRKVSIVASAAMTFDIVPGAASSLTNAVTTAADVDVAEVRTVTLAGAFSEGDVVRVTVDSNDVDFTVTSDTKLATIAAGVRDAVNADGTVNAIVTATASEGVVTLTADANNDAFTLASSTASRTIAHHIAANERLNLDVLPPSTIRAEGTGTLHVSEVG